MARPPHHSFDSLTAARTRAYTVAASLFAVFAMWGSWYPFVIRPLPLDVAFNALRESATPPYWSLTDTLSNLLLFVPMGVFAAPVLIRDAGWSGRVGALVIAAGLSSLLELGQLLVPWRTPSVLDIAAETMGAAAGMLAWRMAASPLDALTDRLLSAWRRANGIERSLWLYAAVFSLAWLMPMDFTIRPDEIADKYAHKRLLLPWMPSPDAATRLELMVAALAAVPIGFAVVFGTERRDRRPFPAAVRTCLLALVALAALQVTVFSRTTDFSTLIVALAGSLAGAALATRPRLTFWTSTGP